LVLVAANADSVSVALSHFESFRVLPERRLPTVRPLPGQTPAHRRGAWGWNTFMSTPISAMRTSAEA